MSRNIRFLKDLFRYYTVHPLDGCVDAVEQAYGISLGSRYLDIPIRNPLLIAPGSMTVNLTQMQAIKHSGYAGAVLKSVVGEGADGRCSMIVQRKKPSVVRTFFNPGDTAGERPIIHWDGRLDDRCLHEYKEFAGNAKAHEESNRFFVIASFLCHLPFPGEDFIEDEWTYTSALYREIGYKHVEIDFCPFLLGDNYTADQENVLRWYRTCTSYIKRAVPDMKVFPKILNLEWGIGFQTSMAEAAIEGGADGLVVGNRIYNPEYKSGHGGEELRQRNLKQIRTIRDSFPKLPISATGGVYSGRDVYEYMKAGAENVQILSYVMGRVDKPFAKSSGSKLEKVFHKLILDPYDGLVACILKEGHWNE